MTYLRNIWYVAAWADQVPAGEKLVRRILNEGLLLFRDAEGRAVALRDRCPHRYAPLHLGKLNDGVIECGYHGLQFNAQGACIFNPHGDGVIPPLAKVESYPVEERHDALWIWMGDKDRADPALIPDFSSVINDGNTVVRHYLNPQANYELMIDNLLDLGHTAFLHPDSLGSEAIIQSTRRTRIEGDTIVDELWAPDGDAPPMAQFLFEKFSGVKIDHWLQSTWIAPSLIRGVAGYAPAGRDRADSETLPGLHWLTPETDTTCHYFAALGRNFRREDAQLDAIIDAGVMKAFGQEDMPMVAAIQGELAGVEAERLHPLVLSTDKAGIMARGMLRKLIKKERAEPAEEPSGDAPDLAMVGG
jgi:phenylpropionate dioxygenase-like ring-hydroxylating dioxygenase large terminal subunit